MPFASGVPFEAKWALDVTIPVCGVKSLPWQLAFIASGFHISKEAGQIFLAEVEK